MDKVELRRDSALLESGWKDEFGCGGFASTSKFILQISNTQVP